MLAKFRSALLAVLVATPLAFAPALAQEAADSGRIAANGVDYYYEVHGEGEPLLLLHGGLGTSDMFDPIMFLTGPRDAGMPR